MKGSSVLRQSLWNQGAIVEVYNNGALLLIVISLPFRQNPPVSGPRQPTTPPRPLIARPWASTTPTILSHTAFNRLCSPVVRYDRNVCQLEMFLGSMFLKKHLCRAIQGDELVNILL